ncbi:rho GTPase-activating protein 1-like [Dorcoceras hygrometricum]|uniref:Rho GTPase-activating protein 1-like n=1 Tax=Dorcoceras hygrometricum TaxID=472368 RepID=A0A2Z7CI97_9LAMI|nr:rho GTPase-activating protein 1-like [Dorcoceras hygrometricum]
MRKINICFKWCSKGSAFCWGTTADPDHASRRGSGRTKIWPGDDQYNSKNRHYMTFIGRLDCYLAGNSCLAPTSFSRKPALHGLTRSAWPDSPRQVGRNKFRRLEAAAAALGGGGGGFREEGGGGHLLGSRNPQNPLLMLNTLSSVSVRESRIQYLCDPQWFRDTASRGPTTIAAPESQFRTCPSDHDSIGYPRMSASGESSTTMHRLLHASGSHPIPPPDDPKTNQYNQDLGLIHSTNGNHLESPKEGSSIDHQNIYLSGVFLFDLLSEMASAFITNALQVNFESVLGLLVQPDEGVSDLVVDWIGVSTAIYREEPDYCNHGWSQAQVPASRGADPDPQQIEPISAVPAERPPTPKRKALKKNFRMPAGYDDEIVEQELAVEKPILDKSAETKKTMELETTAEIDDVDTIIEKILADTAQMETDVGETDVEGQVEKRSGETERVINVIVDEFSALDFHVFTNEAEQLVETGSDTEDETETAMKEELEPLSKVLETSVSPTPDDESLSIEEHLAQIPDGMMLPSITAVEPTKIKFCSGIEIRGVEAGDLYKTNLPKIAATDKGKKPLEEPDTVKGHPAREQFQLICGDIDFLILLREKVITEMTSFFHSFSLRNLKCET